jgi:hypothetical protein
MNAARGSAMETLRPPVSTVLWAAALGLIACAGESDRSLEDTSADLMVTDSAGIQVISSRRSASVGLDWHLAAPSVEIGTVDGGDPAYALDRVRMANRLPDGRIVILNGGSSELLFYDSTGLHLRTVGGAGLGPGEYRILVSVAVIDDSLWVFDGGLGRVSVLELHGNYVRSFRLDPTADPTRPLRLYRLAGALTDSSFVLLPWLFPAHTRPQSLVFWDEVENLLYSRNGRLLRTIAPASGMEIQARARPQSTTLRQFGRQSATAVSDSLLYYSAAERFEIRAYDGNGRLRRIIRFDHEPVQVTGERWRQLWRRAVATQDDDIGEPHSQWEAVDLPDREPAHGSRMVVSDGGDLWIEEYAHPWEDVIPGWHVFAPTGQWLGVVRAAARLEIHQVGTWGVLASRRDRLGVERVGIWPLVGMEPQ